ncbi:DUF1493 family protein [Salmonella enterica]
MISFCVVSFWFRKNDIPQVPEFTIGMLIASARAGRWLYD